MQTATTRFFAAILFSLMIAGGLQTASAQFDLGARVGYDVELEAVHLGAEARFDLASVDLPIAIKPALDFFFIDEINFIQFDGNAIYHFDLDGQSFVPYAGAGLGISYMSFDSEFIDGSDTSVGLNILGGAVFGAGPLRPFGELRFNTDDLITLTGGVLFRVGD